jgi:ribosomal protein S4
MFTTLVENHEAASIPAWLSFDLKKVAGTVKSTPTVDLAEAMFDPAQVLEYYSR